MKRLNIIFRITAGLIFLTQALMPIFTYNSAGSKQAMEYLGYPGYFGWMLAVFKLLGGLVIIIPQIPKRIKEWAYAGFAIDFICAFISFVMVAGFTGLVLFPLLALAILLLCYFTYHKRLNLLANKHRQSAIR